jgi:hypothetical protein
VKGVGHGDHRRSRAICLATRNPRAVGRENVDHNFGRLFREGKKTVSRELVGIFARLASSARSWWARLEKLSRGRPLGRFFAASRDRLRQVATRPGVYHLANLGGCPAR